MLTRDSKRDPSDEHDSGHQAATARHLQDPPRLPNTYARSRSAPGGPRNILFGFHLQRSMSIEIQMALAPSCRVDRHLGYPRCFEYTRVALRVSSSFLTCHQQEHLSYDQYTGWCHRQQMISNRGSMATLIQPPNRSLSCSLPAPPPSGKGQYLVAQGIYRRNLRVSRAEACDHVLAKPPYLG